MPSGTKILCWREKWHSQRWDFVWVFNFDTYFHFKRKAIRNVCFTFFSHFPIRERFFKFPGRFHYKFDSIFHFVRVYYDLFLWCLFLSTILPSIPYSCVLPSSSFTSDILSHFSPSLLTDGIVCSIFPQLIIFYSSSVCCVHLCGFPKFMLIAR